MNRLLLCLCAAVVAVAIAGQMAVADQEIATFDENHVPNNPMNTYGSFTFGDFGGGAVTDGATSLILNITDTDASNGVFGGIGVDYGTYNDILMGLLPIDFNPVPAYWELRLKILPNNAATAIRTTIRDMDVFGTSGDEHVYEFDLTGVPNDGNFHSLLKPMTSPLFSQGAFNFLAGDGLINPGLDQMQIQSVFGSTGVLNVEVDYATIWTTIPEPTSLALLGLASVGCLAAVRRRWQ